MDKYKPLKEELLIINERFAKEEYKSEDDLYVFPLLAIDNQMTAYYTKAHPRTLEKWAEDLKGGVSFLIGHEQRGIPIARSFKGVIHEHEGLIDLYGKFFMQRGIELQGIKTDDFMKAYLGGTLEDVSIGFKAGWYECSICGLDIRDPECPHMPGKEYDIDGKKSLCFAWIMHSNEKPSELVEISAVYKGAVKRAKFKGKKNVPSDFAESIEELKKIPIEKEVSMCFDMPFKKVELSEDALNQKAVQENAQKLQELEEKVKTLETNNKVLLEENSSLKKEIETHKETIKRLEDELTAIKDANLKLQDENSSLKATSELGKLYKEDLVTEILELGVKLHGNSFDKETHEKMLKDAARTIDELKKIKGQYIKELNEKFPPGRQTNTRDIDLENKGNVTVPDEAFKIEGR